MHRYGLYAAFHLCCIFLLCIAGFLMLGLFFAPEIRMRILEQLFCHPEPWVWVGSAFVGLGVMYALGLWFSQKGDYLYLKMGPHRAEVAVPILREAIEELLKKHFSEVAVDVVRTKPLEIEVLISGEKILAQLEDVEKPLSKMLHEKFGYRESFSLVVKNPLA